MRKEHHYFVYILANRSRTLYIGVTNNLLRRVAQHRAGTHDSFTASYRIHRLVTSSATSTSPTLSPPRSI